MEELPVAEAPDYDTEVPDSGRGAAFDHLTDQQTSAIAERFKPETGTAREPTAERREPELPGAAGIPRARGAPAGRPHACLGRAVAEAPTSVPRSAC